MAQTVSKAPTTLQYRGKQPTKPSGSGAPKAPKRDIYIWEGKSRQGEVRKGEMEASDRAAVESRLVGLGLTPTKIRRKGILDTSLSLPTSISGRDLLIFVRQFATMIDAGLPIVQCLEILGNQTDNAQLKKVILAIKARVEAGSSFSDALKDHPKVFDDLFVSLCAAGEVGGILDTILQRLAVYREKAQKLRGKVRGALTYPIVVLAVGVGVTLVLLLKVTPVFEKMFNDMGSTLPAPTQMFIDFSRWLQANFLFLVAGVVLLVFGITAFYRSVRGREFIDALLLRLPIVGDLLRKIAVARFTRTLGTMISSGVPILDAMDVTRKTAGNRTVEKGIEYVRTKISEGKNIAGPLAETKVFPSMVVQMIGVGEATGAMDQMLSKIADFYDEEVDVAVGSLTALLEPIMMVFLGAMVGGFLIAMYLPIFDIANTIQ